MAATYPLRAARLFLLCVSLEVFATPTRRYHGRMLIHPSSCVCHTKSIKGVCTHAGSGPSRVRRRLLVACLGDPISLANTFKFDHSSDNGLVDRKTGCLLSTNVNIIFSATSVSFSLWTVFTSRVPFLF